MDLQLAGKRALVTGSSSGIGTGIARELAAEGCAIVVHGRDRDRAEDVAAEIVAGGGKAAVAIGPLSDEGAANAIADTALAAFGGIDILVNNAGGLIRHDNAPWTEVSSEEFLECYNQNVISAVRLAKRLVPGMTERGWGRIINISSAAGTQWSGGLLEYGAAKAALDHLTGNMSQAVAGQGITVNAIIPGIIMTPPAKAWVLQMKEQHGWPGDFAEAERLYMEAYSPQPIARLGRVEEIAAAAAFFASPRSDYTSGVLMRIDGGNTRGR